jgi:transcriptional regulator with XRE-family HTH domain
MSRALGAWLRQERQARGWDVPEMARRLRHAATSIDATLPSKDILIAEVRRWERGRVGVSERYKLLYCKAFEIAPAEFYEPVMIGALAPVSGWQHVDPCIAPAYAETVRRDEFLKLTSATLASLLGPPLVHGWQDRYILPQPELCDMLLGQLQAQTEGFRWLDRQRGSRSLLQATTTHARELTRFWRVTDPVHPLRGELGQIAADASHLVAYQMFDQGKRVQAIEWYRCSAELAAQARTQDLYVFAMCGVAYMHSLNADGDLAMSVLDQLAALPLPMTAQCYIAVYQAHAYASLREHKPALQALDGAAVLAAKLHDEPPSSWLGMPDDAFVQRQRAMIAAKHGSAGALDLLSLLDESTPEVFQRYRVTLLADQALIHASLGHVEQSAALLASAAQRNQRIRSAERAARILQVRAVLNHHSDSSVLSDLDEALESSGALSPGRRATGQ